MRELIKKGEFFDYILYDLTEIPVTTSNTGKGIPHILVIVWTY